MNNHKQLFRGSTSTKLFFIYLILGGIGIWKCWFLSRVETVVSREKPLGAKGDNQQQTPNQHMVSTLGFEPSHTDGKRVPSPLHHPCSLNS